MAGGMDNLIPISNRTKDEQREIQRKGGKASGKKRKQQKTFRELTAAILPTIVTDDDMTATARKFGITGEINVKLLSVLGVVKAACSGDIKAFEKLMELAGEGDTDGNGMLDKLIQGLKDHE